jgi:hypothetical protein
MATWQAFVRLKNGALQGNNLCFETLFRPEPGFGQGRSGVAARGPGTGQGSHLYSIDLAGWLKQGGNWGDGGCLVIEVCQAVAGWGVLEEIGS